MATNCQYNEGESVGLLLTYRCNLDCKYCYISQKKDKDMPLSIAKSVLEPYLNKDNGWLDIIFVGAETLCAFDVIKPLVEWAESANFKRNFRFFGSTNGTLLNTEIKDWLSKHKQKVILGLSYDGLPKTQMKNRSRESIDVDFFIQTWPYQYIQMTVDEDSVSDMADGCIYLLTKGAYVHPNVAFEKKEWSEIAISEYAKQLNNLLIYYNSNCSLPPISPFVHDLNGYADAISNHIPQPRVCGAGCGYKVFDVDGQEYPCHMISPLVLSGTKLLRIKAGEFEKLTDFADSKCINCPFTSSCPTCMACNYLYRNDFKIRDNTHCRIMQIEVKAFIKKEVLRLKAKEVLTSEDAKEIDSIVKLIEYFKHS